MSSQDTAFSSKINRIFEADSTPLVMGILNITPDSFFDGGKFSTTKSCMLQTQKMISEGADIIDIGAYSSRPGAEEISIDVELQRVKKFLPEIRKNFPETLLSIDTFRSEIAKQAIDMGVNIINDISGGQMDSAMFETVSKLKVPYVLMHMQGTPQNMQKKPFYNDVTKEVFTFLENQINTLNNLGFNKIIIDPGFGFGKNLEHNYELLSKLEKFKQLNYPILVGFSRKSMITKLFNITKEEALNGTSILNTIGLMKGAKILRVHDVKEAKEVVEIVKLL